jgi:hypothetical protein
MRKRGRATMGTTLREHRTAAYTKAVKDLRAGGQHGAAELIAAYHRQRAESLRASGFRATARYAEALANALESREVSRV